MVLADFFLKTTIPKSNHQNLANRSSIKALTIKQKRGFVKDLLAYIKSSTAVLQMLHRANWMNHLR